MPRFRDIGLAPAATLRSPSRTIAHASTVAVVVPSPATSSVFFATSLTSSAPILSKGSSSSISLAIETPSLVIVGAPHFLSSTTLRPLGPRVTRTASASLFMPVSSFRRASSSKAISLGMWSVLRRCDGCGLFVQRETLPELLALSYVECQQQSTPERSRQPGTRRRLVGAASGASSGPRPAPRRGRVLDRTEARREAAGSSGSSSPAPLGQPRGPLRLPSRAARSACPLGLPCSGPPARASCPLRPPARSTPSHLRRRGCRGPWRTARPRRRRRR